VVTFPHSIKPASASLAGRITAAKEKTRLMARPTPNILDILLVFIELIYPPH
jgi:hypothetical protein